MAATFAISGIITTRVVTVIEELNGMTVAQVVRAAAAAAGAVSK
jgi:ABC-type arginine transport system ATPase subunit